MLLVPTLFGAVTLGDALAGEVTNVGLDRTVVFAFAFIRHAHAGASGLTAVAIGSPVDTAHRSIDFGAAAPFAHALMLRASQDTFLANPAHGTVVVTVANAPLRNAFACLADVPRRAVNQCAQVEADARPRRFGDAWVHASRRPRLPSLAVMPRRAVRIVVAHAFTEVFQTFDELVRRREAALSVLLSLTRRPLVALIHWAPLASARDVHALFDAEMVAAPGSHTAFTGRLLAVALVANTHPGAGGFAGVGVVSAVTAANRLKHPRAIAARRAGNAPIRVRVRREAGRVRALVSDEAVVGRPTVHRLFAATAVLDVMLAAGSIFDRIGLAVLAAKESLDRTRGVATGPTTSGNRHGDGTDEHTSEPKSIHRNSPRTGVHTVCISNFGASARGGKPP
jgi:hypothetical protein